MKISDQQADAFNIYGRFLIEIVNDEEKGEELIKKAQLQSLDKSSKKQKEMLGGKDGVTSETPIIIGDCDIKRLGYIL